MNSETRQDERKGSLDERLVVLERSFLFRWERWFDKNPGTVLGAVVLTLITGFWVYYTWQIERCDKQHQQEISRILKENESKITWLKEQQKVKIKSENDKCEIEKKRISLDLESYNKSIKK